MALTSHSPGTDDNMHERAMRARIDKLGTHNVIPFQKPWFPENVPDKSKIIDGIGVSCLSFPLPVKACLSQIYNFEYL